MLSMLRLAMACAAVALIVGCQSDGELPNTNRGLGGALTPTSTQQYAQQRGISNEQARHELQQKVSDHDAEEAIKNIDDVGVKQP